MRSVGRLAGPVGAQHAKDGAACQGQVDPVDRLGRSESLAEALCLHHQFGHPCLLHVSVDRCAACSRRLTYRSVSGILAGTTASDKN